MLVLGTVTNQKGTSYWGPICKCPLCINPCFRLYHIEKDYTRKLLKLLQPA